MGIATSYHQVLRAQCFPLRPTVSTADHHRCSAPIRGKLCRIRPSPVAKPGRTPPFSFLRFLPFRMLKILQSFSTFSTFSTFSGHAAHYHSFLTFFDSDHLSPPAMHYLILRSHYSQVVVTSIAVAESQDVLYAPSPIPYSSNQRPTKRASGGCYWSM